MRLRQLLAASALLCATLHLHAQQLPAAITTDPAPDKANPATIETFQIPSHGSMLNALAYIAEGPGPHPVVVLLHGFPGNEKNLDLAQAIRRDGWDVVYFDYRGSWGSPGDFSFTHSIEDTQSAIAYLRDAANAKKLRSDPAYIVLIGHSMGGFMARYVGAQDAGIKFVGLISAADMGVDKVQSLKPGQEKMANAALAAHFAAEGMAPLAGCTPESLAKEVVANAAAWNVPALGTEARKPLHARHHLRRRPRPIQRRLRRGPPQGRRHRTHHHPHDDRPLLLRPAHRIREGRTGGPRIPAAQIGGQRRVYPRSRDYSSPRRI